MKRAQAAIEYVLILTFAVLFAAGVLAVVFSRQGQLTDLGQQRELDDFMGFVKNELDVLANAEEGFFREVLIPEPISSSYNISVIGNTFIITDTFSGDSFLYSFPFNESEVLLQQKNFTVDNITISGVVMILEKPQQQTAFFRDVTGVFN